MEMVQYIRRQISAVEFEALICKDLNEDQKIAIKEIFDLCVKKNTTIFTYQVVSKEVDNYFQLSNSETRIEQIKNMTADYTELITYEVVKTVSFRVIPSNNQGIVKVEFINEDEALRGYKR